MLRWLHTKIVQGRALELTENVTVLPMMDGETNHICIDRDNILSTTFDELKHVKDIRITFNVQFYGELAVDSGGPRKEWLRLCNQEIKDKYFDHGLKRYLSKDYFHVGQMVGIALLQNGQLPVYIPEEVLEDVFSNKEVVSPCVRELQRGLDTLGLCLFGKQYPVFLHLLRPTSTKLTSRILIHLLKPKFSEEGTNVLTYEKAVYGKLVKYIREVESGRRVVTLENILEFITGASEEPPLGFSQEPHIEFEVGLRTSMVPVIPKEDPNEVILFFHVL